MYHKSKMKPHRESEIVEGFDDTKIRFRFANEQRVRGSDLPIYASKPICGRGALFLRHRRSFCV